MGAKKIPYENTHFTVANGGFCEATKAQHVNPNFCAGGRRGIGLNEERDQTLNQLLTELDGFESRTGVLLLAATNRPEVLPHLRIVKHLLLQT